ncbi:MAG: glycoside hydrolase family 97 protein [Prolixibacteraceae bacterium]|nr:glycoside hydrolase family 97 protein [Prolixibacteraceae bacterium]
MVRIVSIIFLVILIFSCNLKEKIFQTSPDGKVGIALVLTDSSTPAYKLSINDKTLIDTSCLGFDFAGIDDFNSNFKITGIDKNSFSETWEMPWGERRYVENNYNQLSIDLKHKPTKIKLKLVFRIFNDGVGFRYEFPEQKAVSELIIMDENTQFNLTGDHTCWWIPGDWDIYEHLYNTTKFSEIDALSKRNHPNLAQTYIPENAVNTPITMRTEEGIHLCFHEADLTDYAGMTLKIDPEKLIMTSELVGSEITGYKVKRTLPFTTPWRTIQISENATGLIGSNLTENLNEPNKLGSIPWFHPIKYAGIWWEMHLGKSTWDISGSQDSNSFSPDSETPSSRHGATTENAKRLIDFASENNIGGILVEGWNTGWEHWIGFEDREGVFDFITCYPDYDLKEVVRYGKEKGVELIMHHETSGAPRTYEAQLDTAYSLMKSLGIHTVKTGYVGNIIPVGEHHHGQWMVNHYQKVIETAAKYNIAVNAHEPIKATGKRRTWPNIISREGLRGQEFNAWASDGGNPPEHLPIIAFTRMLAGPIDYTPGIFNIKLKPYKPDNQVNTTLAQQLALYVVINSPVQMVPDLIEYYEGHPAFQFIRDVGVNWEQTLALNGEVGDYVTIAREERETGNWFVGSITDENPRMINLKLNFLTKGETYDATLFLDGADAHWDKNPTSYKIEHLTVTNSSDVELNLAAGGGAAISIIKTNPEIE